MDRLSDEAVDRYRRDGYVVPDFRVPQATLEAMRESVARLARDHAELGLDFIPSPHIPGYNPGLVDCDDWLSYAGIPEVLDIVGALVGEDFAMWGSSLFGKPAGNGKETPWHQDGEYWPIRPLASCAVWIAIDASTTENGCLRVVPGSHAAKALYRHRREDRADWTLNQVIDDARVDLGGGVDIELEPGQLSVHDVYMVHGSRANHSPRRRAGLTYRYMPTTSYFDHAWGGEMARTKGVTDMSERPLYLLRGVDRCGRNDLEIGHGKVHTVTAFGPTR